MKPLVIFHANCSDGFTAAWIADKELRALDLEPELMPHQYGWDFDVECCRDRGVYLLDYSFKLQVMQEIQRLSKYLVVLDHHKTAEAEIAPLVPRRNDIFKFDMNRSGASLAWAHFFGGTPPPFVQHIEDRDLWRFSMPDTRTIMDAVASYPYDLSVYDRLNDCCNNPSSRMHLIAEGLAIGRYKEQQVSLAVDSARDVELLGHRVLAVNLSVANLLSQVAGELAKGRPFGVAYFRAKEGHWVYSLRSTPDGIDVSELARSQGGGGHRGAAGFQSKELLIA